MDELCAQMLGGGYYFNNLKRDSAINKPKFNPA